MIKEYKKSFFENKGGAEKTLLEILISDGVQIPSDCGGRGNCGKCRVRILEGELSEASSEEKRLLPENERAEGWRLACKTYPVGDLRIFVPLSDENDVSLKSEMIHLPSWFSPDERNAEKKEYGFAVDIGTTTVGVVLWDLNRGIFLGAEAASNPQGRYGSDVLRRISYCMENEEGFFQLQALILGTLQSLFLKLVLKNGLSAEDVRAVSVAGNPTMLHFFMGKDPRGLALAPFSPAFSFSQDTTSLNQELKIGKEARVHLLPQIGGHVGGDTVAAFLAAAPDPVAKTTLVLDIGTNGEMLLCGKGRMLACSAAAGPAFEGAVISRGMRASLGAIQGCRITEKGEVEIQVIGGGKPVGICGSGLIEAVSALLDAGLIDDSGKLLSRKEAKEKGGFPVKLVERLSTEGAEIRFALHEDLCLTQKDIRELQLAKGAISTGIRLLREELGIREEEIDSVILTGAFGAFLPVAGSVRVGLIPRLLKDKVCLLQNGAMVGASLSLLSEEQRLKADRVAEKIEMVELSLHPLFQETFLNSLGF